ncbi:MAG TPA: hypothetical protein VHX63_04685 [Acidobacteriaceae bacterium]|jgi:hypothetical protein|nr:hypothetical protein [Acidobacteriaceae bacterium]
MTQVSAEDYFASLHSRLHEAEHMQRRKVESEGWKPEPAKCHENVDFWVSLNPNIKAVRGWMVLPMGIDGQCMYDAHSVIEEDGVLYDITLREDAAGEYIPFLRHIGTDEEFSKLIANHSQKIYPPITYEEGGEAQPIQTEEDTDDFL